MTTEQSYPNVTLVVKNGQPTIELRQSDQIRRPLISGDNIYEYLTSLAQEVNFSGDIQDLFHLALQSDELYLQFPVVPEDKDKEKIGFADIQKIVRAELDAHIPVTDQSPELNAELERNWQGDVFASILNEIYNVLIAETAYQASQVAVGTIQLDENTPSLRLVEQMSLGLQKLDTDLIVLNAQE
jgi:hypothetical protein